MASMRLLIIVMTSAAVLWNNVHGAPTENGYPRMVTEIDELGFMRVYPEESGNLAEVHGPANYSAQVVPHSGVGSKRSCGVPSADRSRIIGGKIAGEDMYPWQTLLKVVGSSKTSQYTTNCGGSLISSAWVLTAAHCLEMLPVLPKIYRDIPDDKNVKIKEIVVHVGAHDMGKSDADDSRIRVLAQNWQQHPQWRGASGAMLHDIGVIRIPDIRSKVPTFMPICLPSRSEADTSVEALTTGWGLTAAHEKGGRTSKVLKALTTYTLEPDSCKVSSMTMFVFYKHSMLCIDPKGGRHTVCRGDSGGPLLKWKDDHYVLIGLTSFGSSNGCDAPEPAAFTRVRHYIDFICTKTAVCP